MTTYSLAGFAAVFDTVADTVLSVQEARMDFTWFEDRAPVLRYDYLGGSALSVALSTPQAAGTAISGALSVSGYGLATSDEVFAVSWDANGDTRRSTVLSRIVEAADLSGPAAGRSVFAVFHLGGDALPPMPAISYFARFMLTQIDQSSYAVPSGALAAGQAIDLAALPTATSREDDFLIGAAAAERLLAGQGNDTLYGKAGDDRLLGQAGDDLLSGGAGRDTINGGTGRDTLSYLDETGSRGAVVSLANGTATDTHGDADTILNCIDVQGSWQADRITGNDEANRIWGFGGADSLNGSNGADTLTGGAGNDTLNGGGGTDEADYSSDGGTGGIIADLVAMTVLDSHGTTDRLMRISRVTGTKYDDLLRGGGFNSTLSGGTGGDTLLGGSGSESLAGELGGDLLGGGAGDDTLDGGLGQDTLSYADETGSRGIVLDMETGEATDTHGDRDRFTGIEEVAGSRHGDAMRAAEGGSQLDGGAGRDTMTGRAGADTLRGGEENDTLTGHAGADLLEGGTGIDLAEYGEETGPRGIDADLGTGLVIDSWGSTDTLTGVEAVSGTNQADLIRGGARGDTLSGGNRDDRLYGMDGNDSLLGGNGNDSLGAGDGDDTLHGGTGRDLLGGGNGNDRLFGEIGADALRGGPGHDYLDGGDDPDGLTGGYGNDTIEGGAGDDTLAGSFGSDLLFGGAGDDIIGAGDDADTLDGGDGDDTLNGGNDGDLLQGAQGADRLSGGYGHDRLIGGMGNDTLIGGPGNDTLWGGGNADLFVFNSTSQPETDEIGDFRIGTDRVQVAGLDAATARPVIRDWDGGVELVFDKLVLRLAGHDRGIAMEDLFGP
ncbi:calcium-binding protein [Mangrovicoccus algicola]|uniref:Calcium-binding protein n=1 Tax=Mangrovicoccus algicola TaxID=2771008 RepID=A0A8J7CYU0_9RHOB|nr:hypothetical protein [Mangrovicoccus algicola]